jgi:hypothetical protein
MYPFDPGCLEDGDKIGRRGSDFLSILSTQFFLRCHLTRFREVRNRALVVAVSTGNKAMLSQEYTASN